MSSERQAALGVDDVGDHQRRQRVELAEAEGLAGEERLEEDPLEAVVGKGDAVDGLALELRPPDALAAGPQLRSRLSASAHVANSRPRDERLDRLAVVGEAKAAGVEIARAP